MATTPDQQPPSTSPKEKARPQAKEGQFHARLDKEAFAVLKRVSEQENLSLNDALNLILRQYETYPRDWAEIHNQVQFALLEIELVQELMESSQRNEEMLIRLLEGGTVDQLIQELRAREEQAAIEKATKV